MNWFAYCKSINSCFLKKNVFAVNISNSLRFSSSIVDSKKIRNIGIISHIDAGKTTTTERILFYAGHINKLGSVDKGSTVTDFLPQERERGITIQSACIPLGWKNHLINLIDTPGHIDFTMEVERCLRVLDGAVTIIDGVAGVEAQTETVWDQANQYQIPRILYINKMDREGASVSRSLKECSAKLKGWGKPLLCQWPIVLDGSARVNGVRRGGSGGAGFEGIVDLISWEKLHFDKDTFGTKIFKTPMAPSADLALCALYEESLQARTNLIEQLSDVDDELLESFLNEANGDPLKVRVIDIKNAIRRMTLSGKSIPVFIGASFRNIGVQPLMDAVVDYLPSPCERPHAAAITTTKDGDKVAKISLKNDQMFALAFKVTHDPMRGALVFVRVYSGILEAKSVLINTSQNQQKERATKLLQVYADDYEEITSIGAGNIGAIHGLKFTKTGDTLTNKINNKAITKLKEITLPPPVFFCSAEPYSKSDERNFEEGLNALIREDPSIRLSVSNDTKQTLIGGMGELHLEIALGKIFIYVNHIIVTMSLGRLRDVHKVDVRAGNVVIGYRESLNFDENFTQESSFVYDRDFLGKKAWASVTVQLKTLGDIETLRDHDEVKEGDGNKILINFEELGLSSFVNMANNKSDILESLKSGIQGAFSRGPFLGFSMTNLSVKVTRVEKHPISPELTTITAIRAAALRATQQAILKAAVVEYAQTNPFGKFGILLEPIMNVNIRIPEKYGGMVGRDLGGVRRGQILSLETEGEEISHNEFSRRIIKSLVPLSSMMGYSTALRSLTQGTGSFSMNISGYGLVNQDKLKTVIKVFRGY
ncbi:Ribosome-releasing factor 2, mitochondrial [Lobulomyces angularis]|nr:Ribosome-releasing factor 2, mitochondrial [Lobulomyces angularis]